MITNPTISVDGLGGDFAPQVVFEGIALALKRDADLRIILTGPLETNAKLQALLDDSERARLEFVETTECVEMGEHPATAVRSKKDSSLVVAARLVKEGKAQGFFSAGSTGACLAAGTLIIGRIKGVIRPGTAVVLPGVTPTILLDTGANADAKPEYLVQFAEMGAVYAQSLFDISAPRIALLNIGAEEGKGNKATQESFTVLKESVEGFIGNVEGNDLLKGAADVVVTDGFAGNIALKTLEGASGFIMKQIKTTLMATTSGKIAGLLAQGALNGLKERLNPDQYGGAPLLGVDGVVCIGHGSSSAEAISSGILVTARAVRADLVNKIRARI